MGDFQNSVPYFKKIEISNRTVIVCNSENDNHLSIYPHEVNMLLAWCCKCKLHNILSSCCPLNTNCYNSEDQSETRPVTRICQREFDMVGVYDSRGLGAQPPATENILIFDLS